MNKKYFLALFSVFGIQMILSVNLANAVPCEEFLKGAWDDNTNYFTTDYDDPDGDFRKGERAKEFIISEHSMLIHAVTYEKLLTKFPKAMIDFSDVLIKRNGLDGCIYEAKWISGYKSSMSNNGGWKNYSKWQSCIGNYMEVNKCDASAFKNSSVGQKSNTPSSSGSSSQSNKKTNRQATASQSLSSVDDLTKKLNEAIDQFNNAHNQKDFSKAFPALKIIVANTQDKKLKAAATNRLGEYYKFGGAGKKDEVKAQALFEQASLGGDKNADAHICENYIDGTGGVTKNHQTAIKYCTSAANIGNAVAMSNLGYLYHTGEGVKNPQLGNEWICKAAKQGDSNAIGNAEKLKLNCN